MIIFLNGNSSTGKSVIARALMRQSERPFLYFSVDHLVNFWIDEKFIAFEDEPKSWFFKQHIIDTSTPIDVHGPNPQQLHWDVIESLAGFIQKGYDLIIDEVLWDIGIFERFSSILVQSDKVFIVKIICNLIEAERREGLRKDRLKGIARSLSSQVYKEPPAYDLTIDTTYTPANECAKTILQFTDKNKEPEAFRDYLKSQIQFSPLTMGDLNLIHRWINLPHMAKTWAENKAWRFEDVENKYLTYVKQYKAISEVNKPIFPYIIQCAKNPIGYIQYYNAYDFPREEALNELPQSLAALDLYIGESAYLNKGLATQALK